MTSEAAATAWICLVDSSRDAARLSAVSDLLTETDLRDLDARAATAPDAGASRLARIALRVMLSKLAGETIARADIARGPHGKPVLAAAREGGRDWAFSLSHSAGLTLVAVGDAGPVGVDLEMRERLIMPEDRRGRLIAAAARVRVSPEHISFTGADAIPAGDAEHSHLRATLSAWTQLEAVAKADGRGIMPLLSDLGVFGNRRKPGATGLAVDALVVHPLILPVGPGAAAVALSPGTTVAGAERIDVIL